MNPSGRNSIEYLLHGAGTLIRWIYVAVGLAILIPVFWVVWSWDTMSYQGRALEAMNRGPIQRITIDFNRCTLTEDTLRAQEPFTCLSPFTKIGGGTGWMPAFKALPFVINEDPSTVYYLLPWAPSVLRDELLSRGPGTSLLGTRFDLTSEDMVHYRFTADPRNDPWYVFGLFRLAPSKEWDWGTGPDYAFGKVAANYEAYVAAARAVAAMRVLLAGRALGVEPGYLAHVALRPEAQNPVAAFYALHRVPTYPSPGPEAYGPFLRAYGTDFNGLLPVVEMDLQRFDSSLWGDPDGTDRWDQFMAWHPRSGTEPRQTASGTIPGMTKDLVVTGMRKSGDDQSKGRPAASRLDFLLWHTPATTRSEDVIRGRLLAMLSDKTWDALLLEDETKVLAHKILAQLRKDMAFDRRWARRFGHVVYCGDVMRQGPGIMSE